MLSLVSYFFTSTDETEFIFNLFHLLLAGLIFLVLIYQSRNRPRKGRFEGAQLLAFGFLLIVLHFALLMLYFGAGFYFHKELPWQSFQDVQEGLLACGVLLIATGYMQSERDPSPRLAEWAKRGCGLVAAVVLAGALFGRFRLVPIHLIRSGTSLGGSTLALVAVALTVWAVLRGRQLARKTVAFALATLGAAVILHQFSSLYSGQDRILVWNTEQHFLSISLFAFAWATGERSHNLLDRVFVRLNLTFILLASLIMLGTAGMEKYQYLRLSEERSMDLAEFLRGHITYYGRRGEGLQSILQHSEVLRRVVVEFGTLPELREVNIYLSGQRASFWFTKNWEIKEQIVPISTAGLGDSTVDSGNSFQMIERPINSGSKAGDRVELIGTMDYLNEYIGKYIMLIYLLFTVVVGLATLVIGIIVHDMDRRLGRQYDELQEAHRQLGQASKLASVGQLAGGMAHEINTPITSILSLSSHLADGKRSATMGPDQRKSLQIIAQQAGRVSKIVRNLLTFSRQSNLELEEVNLRDVLESAVTLVQYRLSDKAIRMELNIPFDLPPIFGDSNRLVEVFVNLLTNSIDAMPNGGTLTVGAMAVSEPESSVQVEIADTGCGIATDDLGRIFDPFFTTKEPGEGTGLGLSISHGIVKDHGGGIWAESQLGEGTQVIVSLPTERNDNDGTDISHR